MFNIINLPINPNINQTDYIWFKESFSEEQLEAIKSILENTPWFEPESEDVKMDEKIRKCNLKYINLDTENNIWLYDFLCNIAFEANNTLWGFELHSIMDSIEIAEYGEDGGHFDWHVDLGPSPINHRKIGVMIQLTDPEDYEGGKIEFRVSSESSELEKGLLCGASFPSFLSYKINPVTKGKLKILTFWVGGSSFK